MTERYVVPGLDRALTILELLAQHADGLSMIEIAARTGYPNNSVYRIAMTLCRRGYLRRSPDTKRFTITRKFLNLAFPSVHHLNIIEVSMDVMEELRDEVGESVLLAVFNKAEGEGVVLAQSPALHPIRLMVEPGTRFDLYSNGPGKAMLGPFSPRATNAADRIFRLQTPHLQDNHRRRNPDKRVAANPTPRLRARPRRVLGRRTLHSSPVVRRARNRVGRNLGLRPQYPPAGIRIRSHRPRCGIEREADIAADWVLWGGKECRIRKLE